MRTLLLMWTMLHLTSPLAPHNTPLHNTPQSLWRTTQQINALDAHAQNYGPVLVACTARDFLRGCAGVEAFSIDDDGCDCVLEGLNASLVNCGDGTALLRVEIDVSTKLALRTDQNKRPPRARFVDEGEAVFAGRGADVCELVIALGGDAFDGTTGTIKGCTLVRRGADAVLTGDAAHVVAPLPSYASLPTAGAAWAASVVDELVRQGVDRFVIAPGARSAPLALACARDPHVRRTMRVVHDERAAAFYALGHARARSGSCACVVTTSGTAVANLLPAACEADRDGVSIIFATADRPAEMRGVGADQVLERQQDLLRSTVRRAADLPPADDRVAALGDLGEVSSIAAAALREEDPGPTHVNLAFRENLAPRRGFRRGVGGARNDPGLSTEADWDNSALQGARYATWASHDDPWTSTTSTNKIDASQIMDVLRQSKRGVVVVGRLAPNDITEVAAFLDELRWPVVHADVRSGLRDVDVVVRRPNAVLEALKELRPDCVLQLGAAPAFAPATRAWLDAAFCSPNVRKIVVAPGRSRIDDDFATSVRVEAPPYMIARALYGQRFPSSKLLKPLLRAGIEADEALRVDGFSEPFIARAVTEASLRHRAGLFVSNSMPIRDCDRFGVNIRAEANRGLAGIDGVVATALGYAENHDSDTTYLLIGDQAMLHDAGSLRAVADAVERRLRIVVVDNGGGGIFSFLPLASNPPGIANDEIVSEEVFETLFGATHSVDFVGLVEAHGLTASRASSASEFERLLDDSSIDVVVATPEVQRKDNVAIHRALEAPAVEAARRSMSHNLAYERFHGNGPPVVLLHGLFGSREDLRPLQAELAGREVVMVDLAGHGASATEAGYSYDDQVDGLLALVETLYDGPVDMVGYSLGARLALGCKLRRPSSIGRVVAVSARLIGLEGDARDERRRADKALAARVRALKSDADWAAFFDDVWYAEGAKGGLWGELRRSGAYDSVRQRRLARLPKNAAASLERAGLGDQPDLRDMASREDVLLVHGAHDDRCAGDAADLKATVLPGGHALLDEAPDEIAAAVHGFLSYHHDAEEDVVVTAAVVEDFSVATRKPRENAWAGVASETDAGAVEGAWICLGSASGDYSIGEAAPCRGVHAESAADARAALRRCAAKLEHVTIPAAVKQLDGSLNRFLHDVCGADAEIPSVRFALETAVVGLITRSPSALYASALGRGARGSVEVAALVDGEDDAPAFLPHRVVKLKAGVLAPERDAARVRDAVKKHYKVRVDANRRWSREQYETFLSHLNGAPLDFVEEPPFARSNIPAALDETLAEADWSPAFDDAEVLVAKPALIGLERTLALARRHGRVVASSCFEAGAGLAHVAALGAALADDAHGLGTYAWLAEDPFAFEELLDDNGAAFDVGAGEDALRAFAQRVFERRHHDH